MAGNDDAAKDISQDRWLRAIRGIPRLRDARKLRPWLPCSSAFALVDSARFDPLSRFCALRFVPLG